jgi:ketosteroid isomerase-like protein
MPRGEGIVRGGVFLRTSSPTKRETMSSHEALSVARRYHQGWSSGNYEQSIDLLAPTVKVEVPINDYPTAESFAQALRGFGEMVTRVELLSEMGHDTEAILLYDMQADGLGQLRVAEHFTVADGKIVKLRQIHDTAPVRAAGLG